MGILKPVVAALTLLAAFSPAQTRTSKTLDIYVLDVEGGNATLFVAPSGESVLIDTGNGGVAAVRDADRIMAAVKDAGITQIDHLITTHFHGDHTGGMAQLATRIPIHNFIDHGPSVEPPGGFLQKVYPVLYGRSKHTIVKPGDKIAIAALDWRIVTAAGEAIDAPLPGAGSPNALCASFTPQVVDGGENAQSVGSVVTFGRFRAMHLGDLTWNKEFALMCPNNRVGAVDLFVTSHHGVVDANSPVLVHAIRPRVAILNNGTRKGGDPDTMKVLYSSPGLEGLWQLHFSLLSGQEYTVPGLFIANRADEEPSAMPRVAMPPPPRATAPPPPAHDGRAYWIKVSAHTDGTFTVINDRSGFSKTYVHPR